MISGNSTSRTFPQRLIFCNMRHIIVTFVIFLILPSEETTIEDNTLTFLLTKLIKKQGF